MARGKRADSLRGGNVAWAPTNHSDRLVLSNEVHARPPEAFAAPGRASYIAVHFDAGERDRELAHIRGICEQFSLVPPVDGASHFAARFGDVRIKWERHGEFSGYTFFLAGKGSAPFAEPAIRRFPADWLESIPGRTMAALHVELIECGDSAPDASGMSVHFGGNAVVGGEIGGGAGYAFSDFRIHEDGCARILMLDRAFTPGQSGRMLQRLLEIEAYRMMSLLALPMARQQSAEIRRIEAQLAALTRSIAKGDGDEVLLGDLTRLAAEVESALAASLFRFGASRAYFELVTTRIAELRERRIPGIQTIEEFMAHRLVPAASTCASTSRRLEGLSERVTQASGLLSTRVGIARERQNQALLASMDRRARIQLRLQQAVEGLSVAAITYYLVGLVGYAAKAAKELGINVDPDLAPGLALPPVLIAVLLLVRSARRRIVAESAATRASGG